MPRIYNSMNEPQDFCWKCFPDEVNAEIEHGNMDNDPNLNDPDNGNGFGYDCAHPCYEWVATNNGFDNPHREISPEAYECDKCSKVLREVDNGDGAT